MQITQTKSEELSREFTVTMTAEEIDQKVNQRLEELSKEVKMPGFRPGKVPMSLMKSKYGKAVMGEVLELAVNESTMQAINENNLRPSMRPKIEVKNFDEKTGLEYSMAIEVLPEIAVSDISKIKLEKLVSKPDDSAMKEALERIAKSSQTTEKVEEARAARTGDVVVIDFDGTVDGESFPGMQGKDYKLELGSKSFVDSFEEQLAGVKAGGEKTVKVTFPKDYNHEPLRGVEAVFKVDMKEIHQKVVPTIDADFATKAGFESVEKLEEAVRQQIQNEYDSVARMNVKRAVLDALDETHDFALPPMMVEAEFEGIWRQVKGQGHAHDEPGHVHGPDCAHDHGTEEEREEYRDIAARRVKLGLLLAEIGKSAKVEVTNQELQQAVIAEARRYPGQEREVFEYYQKNPQALEAVKAPVYEEKVVDFILSQATVDTKEVAIDALTKAAEEEPPKKGKAAKAKKK